MTNKDKTLQAKDELIIKYTERKMPKAHLGFFSTFNCPLCIIHSHDNCRGCPLANIFGHPGCTSFESYNKIMVRVDRMRKNNHSKNYGIILQDPELIESMLKRIEFWKKVTPILEEMPASRFTRKGWKYTGNIIPRNW